MTTLRTFAALFLIGTCLNLSSQIVINEVDIFSQQVELKNQGPTAIDVTGYRLCNFPNYPSLTPGLVISGSLIIPSGGLVLVNGSGLNLSPIDDELGLYLPTGLFSSSAAIVDYIEWGSTPHNRSSTGVAAGTWTVGNFIPVPLPGQTINFDGSGNTASDYYHDSPTLGSPNVSPTDCHPSNFVSAPSGLFEDQTTAGGTRTTLKWNHYSDAADGCLIQGALSDGVTNTGPFVQVFLGGNLIAGDENGFDKSSNLTSSAAFTVYNPNTFPAGTQRNLIPGAEYMWRVRCRCIIDETLPLPDLLANSNQHFSPWSEYDFFTNLGGVQVEDEDESSTKNLQSSEKLVIFPNPTSDLIHIDLTKLSNVIVAIRVRNALGEQVMSTVVPSSDKKMEVMDLSSLETGIYMLEIQTHEGHFLETVIKSH